MFVATSTSAACRSLPSGAGSEKARGRGGLVDRQVGGQPARRVQPDDLAAAARLLPLVHVHADPAVNRLPRLDESPIVRPEQLRGQGDLQGPPGLQLERQRVLVAGYRGLVAV